MTGFEYSYIAYSNYIALATAQYTRSYKVLYMNTFY